MHWSITALKKRHTLRACIGAIILLPFSSYSVFAQDTSQINPSTTNVEIELDGKVVTVIKQQSSQAFTQGVAIILSPPNTTSSSQQHVGGIAPSLAESGWASLRVEVPSHPLKITQTSEHRQKEAGKNTTSMAEISTPDTSTETTENQSESEKLTETSETNEATSSVTNATPTAAVTEVTRIENIITQTVFQEQSEKMAELVKTLLPLTDEYPGFVLFIAEGTSAAWLSQILSEQKITAPDGVVLVAPFWPQGELNQQISNNLGGILAPLLMIDHASQNHWANKSKSDRQRALKRARKLYFRHREINLSTYNHLYPAELTYHIKNWTRHMNW